MELRGGKKENKKHIKIKEGKNYRQLTFLNFTYDDCISQIHKLNGWSQSKHAKLNIIGFMWSTYFIFDTLTYIPELKAVKK